MRAFQSPKGDTAKMIYLFILNDSPYGTQRTYNALRMATAMAKTSAGVRIFLLGDGVTAALSGLNPAHADYSPQEMLAFLAQRGTQIGVCRTCMEMRGIPDQSLIAGASPSTMDDLISWTEESDKVLVF
jgi:uncharacterized protein involved in oxidation of intracellular sulfur